MSDLHPARRGRFTRGTRVAWDTLASWLEGAAVLHNRLCGSRDVRDAYARHGIALAEELELVAVASRADLDKLLELLGPTDSGVWGMRDPAVRSAREKVLAAATHRDRHLRRLDGDAEIGKRQHWIVLLLHHNGLRKMDTPPTVRLEVAASIALRQYRADTTDNARVLVLVGFDEVSFFNGDGLSLTPTDQAPRVVGAHGRLPWYQTWRPEIRRWCADLITQRLRNPLPGRKIESSRIELVPRGGLEELWVAEPPQPGHVSATELLFLPGDAVRRSETP